MKLLGSIFLIIFSFWLQGCELPGSDEAKAAYNSKCVEAHTVPFDNVRLDTGTCNGAPILFSLLQSTGQGIDEYKNALFDYVGKQHGLDFVDSHTGLTLAMFALQIESLQSFSIIIKYIKNGNAKDRIGRTYLHYLAAIEGLERFYSSDYYYYGMGVVPDLVAPATDLNAKDNAGRTAAQIAYEHKNYYLLWILASRGADISFLTAAPDEVDPNFFFNRQADQSPIVLDQFSSVLPKVSSSKNEKLVDYAGSRCLKNLALYLSDRGLLTNSALVSNCGGGFSYYLINRYKYNAAKVIGLFGHEVIPNVDNDDHKNKFEQSFAHVAFGLMRSRDYNSSFLNTSMIIGNGFENFIKMTAPNHDLDQVDILGQTPIHIWLANSDHRPNVSTNIFSRHQENSELELLLQNSINHTQLTRDGDSLLSFAVRSGHENLVRTLIETEPKLKAFIKRQNRQGHSPLDEAKLANLRGVYDYLSNVQ